MRTTEHVEPSYAAIPALAAGILLAAGVGPELLLKVQEPDGTVTRPALFAAYLLSWIAGSGALAVAASRLRTACAQRDPARRAGRATACAFVGAVLLCVFGVIALVTGLAQGAPLEAAFLLFALGLLLLVIGQIALARRLRRTEMAGAAWVLPAVAAVALLVGVTVPVDPWHDVGLLTSFAAWALLGARLLSTPAIAQRPLAVTAP